MKWEIQKHSLGFKMKNHPLNKPNRKLFQIRVKKSLNVLIVKNLREEEILHLKHFLFLFSLDIITRSLQVFLLRSYCRRVLFFFGHSTSREGWDV